MSSLRGFPVRGTDIALTITKVHLHPLCVLVEFWGKFCQERTAEYESLARDIQSAGNRFQEFDGNHGDQCLVQMGGTWYRCRIVSRNDNKYTVFLIDRGMTYSTTTANLAWGKNTYFQLPPEVEYCVLANTLPLSSDNRWSPVALEFLKYLAGKSVYAHVQDVFIAHRTFLLDIPSISKQMCEMGLARKLSPEKFRDFVVTSLQPQSDAQAAFPEAEPVSAGVSESGRQQDVFLYPEISAGSIETVVVTHVINPHRFFCQLKVFSKELQKVSDQLGIYCESRMSRSSVSPELIGSPCAARRSDGKWCRSVLQQVFPSGKVVEVLNVDFGNKECVQVENVRPLAAEFFRMPVVTYICSLYGIADRCVGWTSSQIDFLKSVLLNKTVIARFEYQNVCEGVYFVTLHGEDNVNLNNLFGSRKSCLLEDFASPARQYERRQPEQVGKEGEREISTAVEKLPCEDLALNSSQPAIVQRVSSPSEFWIQTFHHANELDELMERINGLCKDPLSRNLVSNPAAGLYCAARAKDGDFYRAQVVELVDEKHVQVFFVDYGRTEVVYRSNIRALPGKFRMLPCLALKCTLAGVKPRDGEWSPRASEYFGYAVLGVAVNVHVAAKHDEDLAVWLTLDKAKGEKDVGALMCTAGFAEKAEMTRRPKDGLNALCAGLPPSQPDPRSPHVDSSRQTLIPKQHAPPPTSREEALAFKTSVFPVGSLLDVTVSHMESPSNFWCQLVQNTGTLNLLMHNIQDHYRSSEFQPVGDAACVALSPENGTWYRALVVHRYKTPHVKVLFVDYGQTETIALCDLRNVTPEFLTLPGQALRCSLLNPVDPISVALEWNKEAISSFQGFVETAASNFGILKCTVFAVMHNEEGALFHIVDLATPFESASGSLADLFKSAAAKNRPPASVCLATYFYSTHNIRVGTEEQMTVTCVNGVGEFFCQPNRNADVIVNLKVKLNKLCQQLESTKGPTGSGALCFARYTDRQWYRGQIKATTPAVLVHFVDYGDTIEVKKSDLLPVPKKVNEIMSVPAQAVMCRLSDVPVDVPHKVNRWFHSNVTERSFRALIVARESDGMLLVELYHEKTQINAELKKMFQIEAHADKRVAHQSRRAASSAQQTKGQPQTAKATGNAQDAKVTLDSDLRPPHHFCENSQKVKGAPLELYRPPHQRSTSSKGHCFRLAGSDARPKDGLLTETRLFESTSADSTEKAAEKLPKLEELPSKSIQSGLEADVYVSHCNSPFSFYVQLAREADELIAMVEELNDPESAPQADISRVHPGDLVQAEFAEDSSWYRAVVRDAGSGATAVVEFVDFGNTAITPLSKLRTLGKRFLQLPVFSVHCLLQGATVDTLDLDATWVFTEKMSSNAEKVLKCKFIRQRGSVWEVSLDGGCLGDLCIAPSAPSEILEQSARTDDIGGVSENLQKSLPDFAAEQTLEARVSSRSANGETREEEERKTGGQVINEAPKTPWKSSTSEYEAPLQPGSILTEPPPAEDPTEDAVLPQRDGAEAEDHAELHVPQTEREPSIPGEHLPLELPEEDGDSTNRTAESPVRETCRVEVVSRTTSVAGAGELPSGDAEDQKVPPRDHEGDQSGAFLSSDQRSPETPDSPEEEAAPAPGPTEQDDSNTPMEQNPTEDVGASEIDLICLHGDESNCSCFESSVYHERVSAVKEENTNQPVPVAKIISVQSTTTAKMVSRESLGLLAERTSKYSQEEESVSPSAAFPPPGDPSGQQVEGEVEEVSEVSGASIEVLNDWMTEEATPPPLALRVEAAAGAANTSPDLHPEQGDEIPGLPGPVEEARVADACSDEGGGSSCEDAGESVCGTIEEMVPAESLCPQEQPDALPSETDQQVQRSSSPEVVLEEELVEEATSLLKEIHLEDVSADPQPEATVESESEILQQTPLKQA